MKADKIIKIYAEERDCAADPSLFPFNQLRVETVNNGTGNYLVISSERWAIDEETLDEFFLSLRDLLKESNG